MKLIMQWKVMSFFLILWIIWLTDRLSYLLSCYCDITDLWLVHRSLIAANQRPVILESIVWLSYRRMFLLFCTQKNKGREGFIQEEKSCEFSQSGGHRKILSFRNYFAFSNSSKSTPALEKMRQFWNGSLLFHPQYLHQFLAKSSNQG